MRSWQAVVWVFILVAVFGAGVCQAQETKTFPVSGKVLRPDGSPASGTLVEARSISRGTDWKVDAAATAGADGKFTMQIAPGSYRICATSGELVYFDEAEMTNVAADGSVSKPIEIHLEKGCKVEGSVIDTSTGQPVGGVKIITRDGDRAESSGSGNWSMVLRKRNHAITAIKEGYWWPIVNFSGARDTVKVKVEIKPGGTIKGRVINEQGQPIAGARVGTGNSGYFRAHGATTDSDGRFVLAGPDPDSKAQVSARADGYEYLSEQPVTFPAGQREAQVELTMKRPAVRMISGRVTRQDGSPVEGATVGYGAGTNWVDYASATTDKDGKYALNKAGIRKNIVVVSGQGLAPAWKVVEADKDVQIDFQMKSGHAVEGRVEDEDGAPVAGAHLTVRMEVKAEEACDNLYVVGTGGTGEDGKFRFENIPDGSVFTDIYAKDFDRLNNERLKVDRKDYTLVLRKTVPGQICGTVLRDSDGKPVPEFNVRLNFSRNCGRSSSGLSLGLCEQGVSFQPTDGKFAIEGLNVKDGFAVVVTAPGYMQARVDPVMVKPVSEEAYKDVIVRLRPAGSFEGSITEAGTGGPVEGVLVTAWDAGGHGSSTMFDWDMSHTSLKSVSTRTGADGEFRFESMPFTSGMIMLEKQGFARTMLRNVRFSRPLQVRLEKGATIAGSIADEQGKVSLGAYISVMHSDLNLRFGDSQSKLNPDGGFKLEDVPPGEYMAQQSQEGRSVRYQIFELKAGETYKVDWVQCGPVTVEGKVLQNGKPVPKVKINVNSRKPGMNWAGSAETGEDGSYKLTLLKPGTYSFSCILGEWTDPNKIHSSRTLQLTAGPNRVDFNLPHGSISGKLVDQQTGRALPGMSVRLYVHETQEKRMGRKSLYFSEAEPTWQPENTCKTDKNGAFQAKNLRAGEWMVCALPSERSRGVPAGTVKLGEGEAKSGVVAKVPPTGSAKISVAGMSGMPKNVMIACIDEYGYVYYPKYENGAYLPEIEDLPVGKIRAVTQGDAYLPMEVPFQVRRDETTNVPIKLAKGPRIVFQAKDNSGEVIDQVSFTFRITTPNGKPVLRGVEGLRWGSVIGRGLGPGEPAAITIKPGTYHIRAAAFQGDASTWGEEPDLTWSGTVKVVDCKDTVVEIPLEQ